MPLTDTAIRHLKSTGEKQKSSDGGGLQLWALPGGAKTWRYAYRINGKQKNTVLGQLMARRPISKCLPRYDFLK